MPKTKKSKPPFPFRFTSYPPQKNGKLFIARDSLCEITVRFTIDEDGNIEIGDSTAKMHLSSDRMDGRTASFLSKRMEEAIARLKNDLKPEIIRIRKRKQKYPK